MVYRSVRTRMSALVLCIVTIAFGVQLTFAGSAAAASPLGTIVTQGSVTIGNTAAPTGTTIFAGDRIASSQPTLVNFSSGSRIEMTGAAATFSREAETLVIKADQGLLRFSFKKGESVLINAGKFRITGIHDTEHVGELGLNRKGQLMMTVSAGAFSALNTETGATAEVTPAKPLTTGNQSAAALGAGATSKAGSFSTFGVVAAGSASAVGTIVGTVEASQSPSQQ